MFIIKKVISVILISTLLCVTFVACSSNDKYETDSLGVVTNQQVVPTEEAVIKSSDAISFLEDNYTKEELGLDKISQDYKLMVASDGVEYNNKKYIKVVANVMTPNEGVTTEDGQQTYSMRSLAEFLIAFDGKSVLMRNLDSDAYTQLEVKSVDYSSKGDTTEAK